jgi:hypothetical protein
MDERVKRPKASGAFEKSAQKRLLFWAKGVFKGTVQIRNVFLLLFVHKKKCFLP